jgi:hypothetical protein
VKLPSHSFKKIFLKTLFELEGKELIPHSPFEISTRDIINLSPVLREIKGFEKRESNFIQPHLLLNKIYSAKGIKCKMSENPIG